MVLASKPVPQQPRLLDRLAEALHQLNYLTALVHDYVGWVRRFIYFHDKRHPVEMGWPEIQKFLDYLAGDGEATSFQRAEAERALRILYAVVLEKPLQDDGQSRDREGAAGLDRSWKGVEGANGLCSIITTLPTIWEKKEKSCRRGVAQRGYRKGAPMCCNGGEDCQYVGGSGKFTVTKRCFVGASRSVSGNRGAGARSRMSAESSG